MSTSVNPSPETPDSTSRRPPSTAAKLVQAAALAAVLVPLGSVAMEAGPITCGFSGYASEGANGGYGCSFSNGDRNRFNWDDYYFDLTFEGLDPFANFDVTITDNSMTTAAFEARAAAFPGYTCIPLTDGGPCVDFVVEFDPEYQRQWESYTFEIHWTGWESHPEYDGSFVRVLHDIGSTSTNAYDEDMCLAYGNCVYDPDPGIRTGDTDFRSFTPALAPIPEPSSLILLGTGLSGFLYRRRRRRQHSEAEPTV